IPELPPSQCRPAQTPIRLRKSNCAAAGTCLFEQGEPLEQGRRASRLILSADNGPPVLGARCTTPTSFRRARLVFRTPSPCSVLAYYEILGLRNSSRSANATLPNAAHPCLPYAAGCRGPGSTHASRRARACRARARQHGRRQDVRGIPRRNSRGSRGLASNRRHALRLAGAPLKGEGRWPTANPRGTLRKLI